MRFTFRTYLSFMRCLTSLRMRRHRCCSLVLRLGLLVSCDESMRIIHMFGWRSLGMGSRWSVRDWMLLSRFGCVMHWHGLMYWCSVVCRCFVVCRSSFMYRSIVVHRGSMVHWSLVLDNRSLVFRLLSGLLGRGIHFHEHLEVFNWDCFVHSLIVRLGTVVFLRSSHVHRLMMGSSGHFVLLHYCLVVGALYVGDWGVLDFLVGYVWVLDVVGFGHLVMRFRRFVMGNWCLVVGFRHLVMRFRRYVMGNWCLVLRLWRLVVGFSCLVVRFWCLVMRLWRLVVGFRCLVVRFWCLVMRLWRLWMRDWMVHRFMGLENHVGIMLHWKSLILQWNDNRSCIGMGCHIVHRCFVVSRHLMSHFMLRG